MMEALRSELGPYFGLLGAMLMMVFLAPKIAVRWRGARARRYAPQGPAPVLGLRSLNLSETPLSEPSHPVHGQALAVLKPRPGLILVSSAAWFLPLCLTCLLPPTHANLRDALLIVTIPMAAMGLATLAKLRHRVTFYRTGMIIRRLTQTQDIDYNDIVEVRRRLSIIPKLSPAYLFKIEGLGQIPIDSAYFRNGDARLGDIVRSLSPRQSNAAKEALRQARL
ncbi:MAG: hypothetical protein FWC40_04480 [Proteobacteria bacterium]|nr:hypothetical protein [Pseudomonadota bacterium]